MGEEKKLGNLFDYQKFEGNGRLGNIIKDTEKRAEGMDCFALDDDDLENVAGGFTGFNQAAASGDNEKESNVTLSTKVTAEYKKYFGSGKAGIGGGNRANI